MAYHLPLSVKKVIHQARQQEQSLVLATGVFDVLHKEHINFLRKAKQAGDVLLVAIETDERVRLLKGSKRPINREQKRLTQLRNLGLAKAVFLLPQNFDDGQEHRTFMRKVQPDILAVSSHTPHLKEKQAVMQAVGGKLKVVHQYNPEVSTSKLVEQGESD